jgi:Flp pilus assembly pilin Flp
MPRVEVRRPNGLSRLIRIDAGPNQSPARGEDPMIRRGMQAVRDRRGVTAMEYAVLAVALVVAAAVGVSQSVAPSLGALFWSLLSVLG